MARILIADTLADHYNAIIAGINSGYGSDITSEIEVLALPYMCRDRAEIDNNIIAIIRSYGDWGYWLEVFPLFYPRLLSFFSMGSNTFEEITSLTEEEPPNMVLSGAGDAEARNNTGYGNGLEFWDIDLSNEYPEDASSYSNGVVFGKLLKIKDTLNCTWWEARYRARATALQTESNRLNAGWDLYNGYGKIDVAKAIAYKGVIPIDPYLFTLADITELEANNAALTEANAALTEANVLLSEENTALHMYDFTEDVAGIAEESDTNFGLSEAYLLKNITVNPSGLVTLTKALHRDSSAFAKTALKEIPEKFTDSLILDFIYRRYQILHSIPDNDLIT